MFFALINAQPNPVKQQRRRKEDWESQNDRQGTRRINQDGRQALKVHKIEIFFGFDFEICIISLLFMSKY